MLLADTLQKERLIQAGQAWTAPLEPGRNGVDLSSALDNLAHGSHGYSMGMDGV